MAPAALLALLAAAPTPDPKATAELYRVHCQSCHMVDGNSPLEPMNFTDGKWKHGSAPEKVEAVIAEGIPRSAMLPFKAKLTPAEVKALAEHVRAFDRRLAGGSGKGKK